MLKENLKVIDTITNLIQGVKTSKDKNNLAYMIHCIIDGAKIDYDLIASYKIKANSDLFIKVQLSYSYKLQAVIYSDKLINLQGV